MSARRTARLVASPAAQLLREPVFGAWRYVRRLWPSTQASDSASRIWSAGQAEHLRHHSGRGHLDQNHVVEANLVERVLEREAALDLVCLDHRRQHRAHGQRSLAAGNGSAGEPVGDGEDAAQIVRRVAPLGGQPGVVEIQPANHGADVEGGLNRVQLKRRARNFGAVGHDGSRHHRPQQLGAGRILKRLKAAAQRVDQAVARGGVSQFALDGVTANVIGNIDQNLVIRGTLPRGMDGHSYLREKSLGSFCNGDKWKIFRPGVVGCRADDLAIGALLEDMSAPTGGTGQHKERSEHRRGNTHQVIGDGAEPIQVGEHALGLPHHGFEPLGDAVHGKVAGGFSQLVARSS